MEGSSPNRIHQNLTAILFLLLASCSGGSNQGQEGEDEHGNSTVQEETFSFLGKEYAFGDTIRIEELRFGLNLGTKLWADSSKPILDSLEDFFKRNPEIKAEVGRCYPSRLGPYNYYKVLSRRYAETLCSSMFERGIDPSRLKPMGLELCGVKNKKEWVSGRDTTSVPLKVDSSGDRIKPRFEIVLKERTDEL